MHSAVVEGAAVGCGSLGTRRPGSGSRPALRHVVCLGKLPHSQVKTAVPMRMVQDPCPTVLGVGVCFGEVADQETGCMPYSKYMFMEHIMC